MTEILRGYVRDEGGALSIVRVLKMDGKVCDMMGIPMERTDETVELQGWPDDEAQVYLNDGGLEVLVAEKSAV